MKSAKSREAAPGAEKNWEKGMQKLSAQPAWKNSMNIIMGKKEVSVKCQCFCQLPNRISGKKAI
ncbi:MAG: hypothetical protein FWG29_07075 [Treponema sp.]|nr:hypothetical protein [Treponema sp.]